MSLAKAAAKNGVWLAGFRFMSQLFSWITTIIIARILSPEDYGIVSMATLMTGYIEIFGTLGLGYAIIQRKEITQSQLSSTFWFSVFLGALFAAIGFMLAYPTAWIFQESRLIPITQAFSGVFIISSLMIIPYAILSREVRFREIGMIQLVSVVASSLSMLVMVRLGFGVWTLVFGTIILRAVDVILLFLVCKWRPNFHFNFSEIRPYVKFGISLTGSGSMFYLLHSTINLIIGKMLGAQALGFYAFAMQLARLPNDKMIPLVKQISFPVLSKFQDDTEKGQSMYLKINKYIGLVMLPIFLGGAFFGDELIPVLLGSKWIPIIFLFKMICLAQLFAALIEINNLYHVSQGRPGKVFYFQFIIAIVMPLGVLIATLNGLNAVVIPWVTVYPLLCIVWTAITLKEGKIPFIDYISTLIPQLSVMLLTLAIVYFITLWTQGIPLFEWGLQSLLIQEILMVMILYGVYLAIFEKHSMREVIDLLPRFKVRRTASG